MNVVSPPKPISSAEPVAGRVDLVYTFRVSRRSTGGFKNLWRLEVSTPDEPRYVEMIDADMLDTVIPRIRLIFEQDGL